MPWDMSGSPRHCQVVSVLSSESHENVNRRRLSSLVPGHWAQQEWDRREFMTHVGVYEGG